MMRLLLASFSLIILITCSSDRVDPIDHHGVEYFLLQTGAFVIYDIDQTIYELGNPSKTNFQLKESVVDSFTNLTGGYTYTLHRDIWDNVLETWNLSEVWSVRRSLSEVVVSEGNTDFLKLKFPLISDQSWNGNLYNTMEEVLYTTDSIDYAFNIDEQTIIDNTVTVIQKNNLDKIVETDYRIEKYAPEIGLIYKEILNLKYCTSSGDCFGQLIVDSGLIYKQSIIAYGDE